MRILMVNNLFFPNIVGGAEISIAQLTNGLRARGHDVKVLSLGTSKDTDECFYVNYPWLTSLWPVKRDRLFFSRLLFQFAPDACAPLLRPRIDEILQTFSPHVVHTNNLAGLGNHIWAASNTKNIPVVHSLRDYYQICARQNMFHNDTNCEAQCKRCKLLTAPRSWQAKSIDALVGNSEFILNVHLRASAFSPRFTAVISGGLDESEIIEAKGLAAKRRTNSIGFIGQIIPSKGVDEFLKIAAANPKFKFKIAGSGSEDYVSFLKCQFSLENIEWKGTVNSTLFYDEIDALIVPSKWHEPLPRVIYEAYSRGVPVIASNVGGQPEVVNGSALPLLYNSGDIDMASRKLLDAFAIEKQPLLNLLVEYSRKFSSANVATKYIDVYERVYH